MLSLGQNIPVEKSVIHVPQGRSARIDKSATHGGVGSLFTYGIGTCQIVPLIGKERFSLMHIDTLIPLKSMDDELDWVGKEAEVIVLFRDGNPVGKVIHLAILNHLAKKGVTPKVIPIHLTMDGIQLFSEPLNNGTIHPHLLIHQIGNVPKNLRRHPQELKFTTAHKIEQLLLIGIKNTPSKKTVLYDGECWKNIPETEFEPYCATEKEHGYLTRLKKCVNQPSELLFTLAEIVETIQKSARVPLSLTFQEFSLSLERHVENYLYCFDYVSIFKLKMRECAVRRQLPKFCQLKGMTLIPDDLKFMGKILEVLQKAVKDPYFEVEKIVEEYKSVKTTAAEGFIKEFVANQEHYLTGKMYAELNMENGLGREKAVEEAKTATIHYKAKEYSKAAEHFEKALRLSQWLYDDKESNLAACYSNYGKTLQLMGKKEEADRFLKVVAELRK